MRDPNRDMTRVSVTRTIVYDGPRWWVRELLQRRLHAAFGRKALLGQDLDVGQIITETLLSPETEVK
jgi:hypothetical protein